MKTIILLLAAIPFTVFANTCQPEILQFQTLKIEKEQMETTVAGSLTEIFADSEHIQRRLDYIADELERLEDQSNPRARKLETEQASLNAKMVNIQLRTGLLKRRMSETYDAFHAAQIVRDRCLVNS